jgi:hydrogenase expression/formation protein HypE
MIAPMRESLPVGKLPLELLQQLLQRAPLADDRVLLGPQVGVDCAVLDLGDRLLVLKSDPITFATADIGRYLVQVNSNDIATTGAIPRWLLVTALLPENQTSPDLVLAIGEQLAAACQEMGISLIGGHTEITHGLERPILAGTLIPLRGRRCWPANFLGGCVTLLMRPKWPQRKIILSSRGSACCAMPRSPPGPGG